MSDEPYIIANDRQFVAIYKPPGLLSQPDETHDSCASDWVRANLPRPPGHSEDTQWNPFVAPVHRLDRPASGLLVLARTSKAADRLRRQFADKTTAKFYLALCGRSPQRSEDEITLFLTKNQASNRVMVSPTPGTTGKEATTRYRVMWSSPTICLIGLWPLTGRSHQLRATLSWLGCPIFGDVRYGSDVLLGNALALHAAGMRFQHPTMGQAVSLTASVPDWWSKYCSMTDIRNPVWLEARLANQGAGL